MLEGKLVISIQYSVYEYSVVYIHVHVMLLCVHV